MARERKSDQPALRRFVKENGLSLFFFAIFVAAVIGQAIAGHSAYNQDELLHGGQPLDLWGYVFSSHFGQALMENWQSEYLQFALFAGATIWLIQRGSPESKKPEKAGLESDRDQRLGKHSQPRSPLWARVGGWRTKLYSHSLLIVMGLIFFATWFAQSVNGWTDFNSILQEHGEAPLSWWSYIGNADFWEATLQNWQSEFLAVGSFAVLTVYLRQRGSPESKPVGSPHDATDVEG
jgi:hypothetical protein